MTEPVASGRGASRPLRLLVIADSRIEVPPRTYGGTERIVAALCEGLTELGHEVSLMARRGSTAAAARLISTPWAGGRPRWQRALIRGLFIARFQRALWRRPDAVISFGRPDYLRSLTRSPVPLIYVFQNPLDLDQLADLRRHAPGGLRIVGLSASHTALLTGDPALRIIPNCANLAALPEGRGEGGYLAFLGRLTRNKGVDTAIRVARAAGLPLRIAGNVSDAPGDRAFFEAEVEPQLGEGVEWVGPVDDAQKAALLGGAVALLNPIRWEEPFGIVVAEAYACGTPVIATPRGSMPELVEDGLTGFLARDEAELVAAVERVGTIRRAACRAAAETRFSREAMTGAYLAVIEELIAE